MRVTIRPSMSLHAFYRALPPMSPQEIFERPFYDKLQPPLQPLMDDLEWETYEGFEQDPVKYERSVGRCWSGTPRASGW